MKDLPQKVDDEVLNLYILRERDQAKINPRDKIKHRDSGMSFSYKIGVA